MEYKFASSCTLPTDKGNYEMRVYKHQLTGQDAMALVVRVKHGESTLLVDQSGSSEPSVCVDGCLLRVQDQCMTSEIFGSVKCDCKQQLDYSMELLQREAQMRYKLRSKQNDCQAEGSGSSMRTHSLGAGTSIDSDSERSTGDESSIAGYQGPEASAPIDLDTLPSLIPAARGPAPVAPLESAAHALVTPQPQAEAGSASPAFEPVARGLEDIVGLVVYLLQEGRGIGIAAKVSAYALQEAGEAVDEDSPSGEGPTPAAARGLDTVDANRALGLPDDARTYGAVRDILVDLGCMAHPLTLDTTTLGDSTESAPSSPPAQGAAAMPAQQQEPAVRQPVYLLTNNPRKISSLRALGVPLAGRLPCAVRPPSELAAQYLRVKAQKMGHMLPAEGM